MANAVSNSEHGHVDGVILCAADRLYFENFAPALIASAVVAEVPLHIYLYLSADELTSLNEGKIGAARIVERVRELSDADHAVAVTFANYDPNMFASSAQKRVFFSCTRILAAEKEARRLVDADRNTSLFLLDIDSIVQRKFIFPAEDVCFYRTDPETSGAQNDIERRGMHLLASCFVRAGAENYIKMVADYVRAEKFGYWFLDQIAYHECLPFFPHLSIGRMNDLQILDSETFEYGAIWSGRGARKFTSPEYLREQAKWKDAFWGRE